MGAVIVAGTDTGIGKTVFSAGLTRALGASYWKPVQAGLEEETDSETVARLSGRPVLAEVYRLRLPASPHLAAEREGVEIDPARLALPQVAGPLVVEGAGGLMVPLTRRLLYLQVISGWRAPVVLCCRTALGTINHALLSLVALRAAGCRVAGVAFIGEEAEDSRRVIREIGAVRDLGRLPLLETVTAGTLEAGFAGIDVDAIREVL
ncbi:ATP-dependent dethiobiotin synthetase BioD (plasmid) [Paracoccus versutus]|uniref:ATP-dependent dethiobiotin synthetase BioD n=1 Tax=Paracoccus versutus TaxID=34007 RepID=A0AAQ0KLT0_PARVE|nr:dethiobiotin synthase [Paracoccus versutus]KGJ05496.1 dethiobiotin synthetase [Paracoccus versutus]REG47630.1 dethiobiotin synthetase [Paracoccus versutus]WEJ81009.1 ATP-dependent dethiobiotin synthetase BioD [Paracoccus versutus]